MLHPGKRPALVLASLLVAFGASPASAALRSVSGQSSPATSEVLAGGDPSAVAYSLANGFPLWYQDERGLKLGLCLDHFATRPDGALIEPCALAVPCTIGGGGSACAPVSFPNNFGPEAFWWAATVAGTFASIDSRGGTPVAISSQALLVLAQEAGFGLGLGVDGNQAAFGRIRIRLDVPVAGTYRVTHPYGTVDYVVTVPGLRAVNQTQDVGNLNAGDPVGAPPAGNFLLTLLPGRDPSTVALPVGYPGINAGIVSSAPTGIGPFLEPADHSRLASREGAIYLADPGTDLSPRTVRVTGGRNGNNVFKIELLDPPPDFVLNALDRSQVVVFDRFQLLGKLFQGGPNLAPVAHDDFAATAKGKAVVVDVLPNDVDPVDPATNVHGIDPQALGLPSTDPADPPGTIRLTRPVRTANGGTVQRFTEFATGRTRFVYTPAPGFAGVDTFQYVVQDRGGLVSAPATVTVTVEDLAVSRAEYRTRLGTWRISGVASDRTGNAITLRGSPRARLTGASEVPAVATDATGNLDLFLGAASIDFRLTLEPAAAMTVTAIHLHAGAPGVAGPPIFTLYDAAIEPPFSRVAAGTLTDFQLLFESRLAGINTFADVLDAVVSGNVYVEVRTLEHPAGELRGQLALPVIATVPVDPATGSWSFSGKSLASPGGVPASVNAISANGVRWLGTPLRVR